jgi:transcriptional regulator with GAF, ATPase, and Fis domain
MCTSCFAVASPRPGALEGTQVPGQTLEDVEQQWIAAALRRTGGNIAAAARQLGITRATLLYRARRHGITVGRSARVA